MQARFILTWSGNLPRENSDSDKKKKTTTGEQESAYRNTLQTSQILMVQSHNGLGFIPVC